jgi:transposase
MLMLPTGVKIFVATEPADLRKSFDGLSALVRDVIKQDPLSGHLFVFRNKVGHRIKVLFWDRTGFTLWYKRLESGIFRLPVGHGASIEVDAVQLRLLLDGINMGGGRGRQRRAYRSSAVGV